MYESLINKVINTNEYEFKDFPEPLNGEIYIGGNAKEGWQTRPSQEQQDKMQSESDAREAKAYLISTDWYVIRQQETGQAIPEEVSKLRAEARAKII